MEFQETVLAHLGDLREDTAIVKTKVESLERQNAEQFALIRKISEQATVNKTEIANLKCHRNGKGWLGKLLIRLFVGSV